jgi:hypothetical protein
VREDTGSIPSFFLSLIISLFSGNSVLRWRRQRAQARLVRGTCSAERIVRQDRATGGLSTRLKWRRKMRLLSATAPIGSLNQWPSISK